MPRSIRGGALSYSEKGGLQDAGDVLGLNAGAEPLLAVTVPGGSEREEHGERPAT